MTDHITFSNDDMPTPTFHCGNCGEATEGFSLCLKCNPQNVGIEKAAALSEHDKLVIELREVRLKLEKNAWNEAIEAAAKVSEINSAANIRKLKK